jgi:hypothetical protein
MDDLIPSNPLRRMKPTKIYRSRTTAITVARCRHNQKPFGVHFTRNADKTWSWDYAFRLSPRSARTEGQELDSKLQGPFGGASSDYPGCPCCGDKVLFKCHCGRLTCFVTNEEDFEPFACAWCGEWMGSFTKGWDSLLTTRGDL